MSESLMTFTDTALSHIKKNMAATPGACGFRLGVRKMGCIGFAYVPDIISEVNKDDTHFKFQDVDVYVTQEAAPMVKGTTIDFVVKDLGQESLKFDNPNVESECGCGESFNVKTKEDAQ